MTYLLEQALRTSIQALNWVEKYGGIVVPHMDKTKEPAQVYPISAYNSDPACSETDPYTPITPDDNFKSVVYWEYRSGSTINLSERVFQSGTESLRFVAWINPKKQGVTPAYGLSSIYANDLVSRVNAVQNVTVSGIPITLSITRARIIQVDANEVFGRYSYVQKEHLYLQPFEWFAIDFEFTFGMPKNCASLITLDDEITC
jgi:hypothetical protein